MKTRGEHQLRDDFELSKATLAWMEKKHPTVDVDETVERFKDWARQKGVMYADWQAGFKTVVRKAMDNGWRSIVIMKKASDPNSLAGEAKRLGFRDPYLHESPNSYRTAFEQWKRQPKNVVSMEEWKAQA